MSPSALPLGAVLAGGASRRYGRPKWREEVGGVAMARRALDALAPHVSGCFVVGGDPGLAGLGAPVIPDARPGRGPLGGLETALVRGRDGGSRHVLVLACDLPLVGAATVGAVAAEVRAGDVAVVPMVAGRPQPLCAAWGVAALPHVTAALEAGDDVSLRGLLATLPVRWIEAEGLPGGTGAFLNVNAPADRARASKALGGEGGGGPDTGR